MNPRTLVGLCAVVETATGLGLTVVPALVLSLLLGVAVHGDAIALGRVAGIALLALGFACWPGQKPAEPRPGPFRGLLVYNGLVALYLGHLGAFRHARGLLLWPAVAFHFVVALLLLRAWRTGNGTSTSPASAAHE